MSARSLPSRPSLDQLKRQARELQRARPKLTLAEAQRAVARDYGSPSWADLKHRVEVARDIARIAPHPRFAEALAALDAGDVDRLRDLVTADPALVHARTNLDPPYGYVTGATLLHHVAGNPGRDQPLPPNVVDLARVLLDAGADVHALTLGPNGWDTMGLLITSKQASDMNVSGPLMELLLERGARLDLTRDDARDVVAGLRGFSNWESFAESVTRPDIRASSWKAPLYRIDASRNRIQARQSLDDEEWDVILAVIAEQRIESVDASGQMTDRAIAKLAEFEHVSQLDLAGSKALTDAGLQHLARLPRLHRLDLSGCGCSDRGLAVLRHLRELRSFHLYWHGGVTDAGLANLRSCEHLERVELLGTPVGDETIEALTGKVGLRHLKTGTRVTDAALPRLHGFPAFKSWTGGAIKYSLMSPDAEPNQLLLDGPVTGPGLATLAGLDGLFGLSLFWHTKLTPDALKVLADLPRLGFVGCEGSLCNDEAMRHLAAIPRLRMLMAQGTVATDAGFASLGRSQTLEYIWGRECPNLTGLGFASLSTLPALRGLAVSCKHVHDEALATLPRFPALNELMPMDVSDDGFRHVGRCENLEALWCMYCRDTTDAATAHIEGLRRLKTYYAGQTKITDRSLEILSRVESLEKLEFWNCAGITNAGARRLAALPRLREVTFDTCRHVTQEAETAFPAHVRVRVS